MSPGAMFGRHVQDRHRRAVRLVGYGLALNDAPGWWAVSGLLARRLTVPELAGLAFAVLVALEAEEREAVVAAVMEGRADG